MTEPSQDDLHDIMVQKATELFRVCDKEQNGVISKRDMQRLRTELPSISPEQLEEVFDSLDVDQNGFLTLEEFINGFGSFLGVKPANCYMEVEDGEERVYEADDDTMEKQFQEMLEQSGAKKVFNDDDKIKALWVKLREDKPELLDDFEEFINGVTNNIKQSQNDFDTLEEALRSKSTAHDEEVTKLYEEMEIQIKQERERILKEEKARERQLRDELENEISDKDQQLKELLQRHQEMEEKLASLNMVETETKQENEKLMREKSNLEEMLITSQDSLEESKMYINQLQQQQKDHTRERARAALKMTEGIAMERESLVKQLDHLRDMNRKLRDDKDEAEAAESRRDPSPNPLDLDREIPQALAEAEAAEKREPRSRRKELTKQGSVLSNYFPTSYDRRSSSRASETISEDIDGHLADIDDDLECDDVLVSDHAQFVEAKNNLNTLNGPGHGTKHVSSHGHGTEMHVKSGYNFKSNSKDDNFSDAESEEAARGHNSRHISPHSPLGGPRGQPVGATATAESGDGTYSPAEPMGPERIFKVVFVGDSGVGKSSFIYQFCNNTFKATFAATIGVDFQIKTMLSDGKLIALQLWDTAGQERFRSITKQYFRKADGVIIMYDVTSENSYVSIRNWMSSVKEGVEEDTVLVIAGNKTDLTESDDKRVIKTKDAARLADDYGALFYETSAKSGSGVKETMEALASLLREKEDKSIEAALRLDGTVAKKKGCCGK